MTIWLEEITVQQELIDFIGAEGTITDNYEQNERRTIQITYSEEVEIDKFDLDNISSFLSSIGDGNPEISISANNSAVILEITADEKVYRNE